MADFSLRDAWWLQPKSPDNPLPALQLGVQMSQYRSTMLLKEKELANDIARTEIARQEMEAKQRIQTMLAAGNAEMAGAISRVTDWTDEEQVSRVWEAGARNPMTVGGKAWLGAQHMYESARTAKRLETEAKSRIAARVDQSEYNQAQLRLKELLADHTIPLTDARVLEAQSNAAMAERKMLVQEGNLELREREIGGKETRLGLRERYLNERNALDREEKDVLSKTFDSTESARLRKLYNLKRRDITSKFYGPNAPKPAAEPKATREGLKTEDRTTNAPPAVVAPNNDARANEIKASFKAGTITKEQALQQLRELGFK